MSWQRAGADECVCVWELAAVGVCVWELATSGKVWEELAADECVCGSWQRAVECL